ncbi:hypothetical protein G5V58_01615 [Nocardioides anomalus]|uniref:Bacterial Ig-like domain-containing protein n=1 Tax=Nocardioides anomalus TaxID=2712223 RepID=A0A6G6W8G6_9ACTN|nr:hypothetical protein [Nocardioides anomalus]QIG41641.1 hypothetical protein G5V58_01615 [Nocardioides anomalus]
MHLNNTRGVLALAGLGLAAGLVAAAPAQAATSTIQIRPADMLAPTGTAGGGTQEFLAEGIHLKTVNDTDSFARGRFHVGVPLAQVTTVDYTWYGPSTPVDVGVKNYIDADADGKIDGELRGEHQYGGQDVWVNLDTQDFPDSALPDNFFRNHAPCFENTPAAGVTDPCGSWGGDGYHGTLANWTKTLQAATGKAPVLVDGGYALSGVVADGVLRQITYGPNQYVFTDQAKAAVVATAEAKRDTVNKRQKARIAGTVKPVGTAAKVTLQVKKNGTWTDVSTRDLAADGAYKFSAKTVKTGVNRFRVTVSETNSTAAGTSDVVKVHVLRKK